MINKNSAGRSHRATLITLVVLTLASGTATTWVAATHPKSLLPWVGLFAIAVAWTFRRPRSVDLFEPFTFLSWIHYAPAFVVGSTLLAVGIVGYPFVAIIADPVGACALTLSYVGIAYLALGLGTHWQGARALGTRIGRMLPAPPTELTTPMSAILVLIAIGLAANYGAFRAGIIGFAVPRAPGPLDAALSYAGLFMALGHFLYWFRWFAPEQERPPRITLLVPLFVVVASMVILGNRGALLLSYLHAVLAYRFARGRLSLAQSIVAVALAFVALGVGMAYGTVFRQLRGGESGSVGAAAKDAAAALPESVSAAPAASGALATPAPLATPVTPKPAAAIPAPAQPPAPAPPPVPATPAASAAPAAIVSPPPPSLERHLEVASETASAFFRNPGSTPVTRILAGAGARLNLLSDASVTIVRYRSMQHLEPEYGIVNMWTQLWSGFVPRVLWPGKPKVSDGRAYSALYFHYGGNSYATTPPVDLIRNVGPFGMPLGMALLGVVLGVLSVALLTQTSPGRSERAALFSFVVLSLNMEGSFGMLLPTMFRVALIIILGLGLVRLFTLRVRRPGP